MPVRGTTISAKSQTIEVNNAGHLHSPALPQKSPALKLLKNRTLELALKMSTVYARGVCAALYQPNSPDDHEFPARNPRVDQLYPESLAIASLTGIPLIITS